jgi:hypothetical protein
MVMDSRAETVLIKKLFVTKKKNPKTHEKTRVGFLITAVP